jgi:hypothetical protein
VHVAAVARVPPARLQLMVAPEWVVDVGGEGMDVPGLVGSVRMGWMVRRDEGGVFKEGDGTGRGWR